MGISFVAMGLATSVAWGQGAPSSMDKPAKTAWQKYPDVAKPAMPKLQNSASVSSQPSSGEPGSRVIVYNKPANAIQPVQAVEAKPSVPMPLPKVAADDKAKAPLPTLPKSVIRDEEVFRVLNDAELTIEVAAYIDVFNNDVFEKGGRQGSRPEKVKPSVLLVLNAKLPSQSMPKTKENYSPKFATLEPGYVVHRKLYFEDLNSERYGWEMGLFQPALSATYFFKDVLFWPHKLASNLQTRYDTSAGKCPPGSPVAYYLYPPELSFGGGLIGTGAVIGTVFLFP